MQENNNNRRYRDISSSSQQNRYRQNVQRQNVQRPVQSPISPADYGDHFNENDDKYYYPPQYPKKNYNTHKTKTKKPKRVLKVILTILLVLLLLFGIFFALIIFRINYTNENPDNDSVINEVGELKSSSDVQNILLFGTDNHSDDENGRSDSIILLSIDKQHHILKQTSFLRDLYITIPGYGEDRLNAAYSYGGAKLAVETIEYNFGIKIDNYAIIDFSSFTLIIDAMGGIDLNLTAEEIDYINWQCWKNKQVETRNEINIDDYTFNTDDDGNETTVVHLNGRQALWYARDRDSAGSDFDRTARQRIVMNTVFSKFKSTDMFTLMRILYEIAPHIKTNMSQGGTTAIAFSAINYLSYDRKEYRIPQSDNYYNELVGESEVLMIADMDYEKESLYNFIFESDNSAHSD